MTFFCLKSEEDVKHCFVDIVLLAFTSFFFLRGFFKGFLATVFSFVSVTLIAFLSWKISAVTGEMLSNWLNFSKSFENLINSKVTGTFSSVAEFEMAIKNSGVFYVFLLKMLGSISFEGNLTAGEILAPKLNTLTNRLIAFIAVFVLLCVVFKIIYLLLNKFIKSFGLGWVNRTLGGAVGIVEGVLLSMIMFFVLSALANFLLNESLLKFVQNGQVSNWIYNNLIIKSINFH